MSKEHKTEALAIHCIDFRFQDQIQEHLEYVQSLKDFDRISWPGASKDFDNVSQAAALSIELHDPDEAYIYEHEDCGAYGEDNSMDAHRKNAYKLKAFLEEKKPNIIVTTLIATFAGIKEL